MPNFAEKLDDYLVRCLAYFNYRDYIKSMNLKGDERVLEVGSSGGNLSRFLSERLPSGELICIDNSRYWFEKSKNRLKKFRNVEFRLEDILDFNEINYFDIVVVHYVLHDIKKERAINILRRSLKENGRVYIREPTRNSHGMPSGEIKSLMLKRGFSEKKSKEGYYFLLRGKVYEGIFQKSTIQ